MNQFETLQDAANANTPEGLDFYWANVDHATYFNEARLHQYHEVINYCRPLFEEKLGFRMIDCGCGPGYFLFAFWEAMPYINVSGFDYADSAVEYGFNETSMSIFKHNLLEPLDRHPHDLVFCLQTMEHITEWQLALDNLVNMTKPDGHLIITIPNGEFDNLPQHVNRWKFAEFHEILKPYGDVTMRYLGQYSRILAHVQKGQ